MGSGKMFSFVDGAKVFNPYFPNLLTPLSHK